MTVTGVHKDLGARTMTITSEFDAPIARVWQLWSDPRQLERWWGPPTYPATVVEHALVSGGAVRYYMTGPTGDRHHGYWRVLAVDPPRRLEFEDGFADASGAQNQALPTTTTRVELLEHAPGRTRMTVHSQFASAEAMKQLLDMGMETGMSLALGQIDGILAEGAVGGA